MPVKRLTFTLFLSYTFVKIHITHTYIEYEPPRHSGKRYVSRISRDHVRVPKKAPVSRSTQLFLFTVDDKLIGTISCHMADQFGRHA